jgi:4-amino-4-deoxy-L-arabinose transferase-like glycosyltransferase
MSAELPAGQPFNPINNSPAEPEPESQSRQHFLKALSLVLLLSAAAYLSLAFNWPKFSRAEVFFAECVREMFQADNLVTPLYHGTPFFDKPILAYWFIAASYQIGGINHFAARLPSVILACATVALTALSGRRLFGAGAGVLAGCVLASSFMFMSFASLCMSDMNLVFFDTASLSLLYLALVHEKQRSILLYLGSLSMGLAFLTKGPVGIILPALSFAVYLSYSKQWRKIQLARDVLPCTLILLGAGVPWFMAAFRQNGAGALSYFFIHENLQRFVGSTYDTHRPIWFMVQSLASGMLPWSVFLPFAFLDSLKLAGKRQKDGPSCRQDPADNHVYLWIWIAVVIGFFSLSRGKIDYYALPAYPAAAILIGNYLNGACLRKAKPAIVTGWLVAVLMLVAGLSGVIFLPATFVREKIALWPVLPAILLASSAFSLYFAWRAQTSRVFLTLFVLISLLAVSFSFQIYPWITGKQAVLKYVPYIQNLRQDERVGVYTSLQNWIDEITFQTDREPIKIDRIKMAEQFLKGKSACLLLIQEDDFKLLSAAARQSCSVIASNAFIPRSLNPVYLIGKGQKLAQNSNLLLIANQPWKDTQSKRLPAQSSQ